jgi:hypothetical protein
MKGEILTGHIGNRDFASNGTPESEKALEIIRKEQQLALDANLNRESVEVLVRHIGNYEKWVEFSLLVGLIIETKLQK